ncbi:MAG: hypothetical protein JSU82_17290 [Rhodospirillales bacterium]|nr:MAG: hypothetical protein JSU82_17290 [Rhodospirillales bacterium]
MRWVFLDGNTVSGRTSTVKVPSGCLCTLSAVLVLNHDHPVQRDRIDDILWDGDPPESARDRLNTMLWRLRKLVKTAGGNPNCFENHREYLLYRSDGNLESDALTLSKLTRRLDLGKMISAEMAEECLSCIQSCHSDFLPSAADHWSIVTRESLRSGLLMMIEAVIAYMRDKGRWGRVAELAERMLALDPTLEIGHQQLIDMHGRRQDFGSAKRHYDTLRKVLKESLDVAPAPETAAAIDALRIARSKQQTSSGNGKPRSVERRPHRPALTVRPSIRSVESALDHIDAARDWLLGHSRDH